MNHAVGRHGHGADTSEDVGPALRALGMRMTPQRERVLAAVRRLGHATPDAVAEEVDRDAGAPLSLSTVYRNLEALEQVGIVSHSYLDQRTPSYHLTAHADHLHLICLGCGQVSDAPVGLADGLAQRLLDAVGFVADVRHLAVHGWCAACDAADPQEPPGVSGDAPTGTPTG